MAADTTTTPARDDAAPPTPPAALLDEVNRDLDALARARRHRMGLFALVALALVGTVGYGLGHRHDGFVGPGCGHPMHTAVIVGLTVSGLALVALAFGLSVRAGSLGDGRRLRVLPPLGVAAGFVGLAIIATRFATPPGAFWHGAVCLGTGAVIAFALVIVLLALGGRLLRRHAPTAGLFGVGVGLLGLVPLSLACHDSSMTHLMLWHGAIPLAAALIATLIWRPR